MVTLPTSAEDFACNMVAIAVTVATLASWLPPIAALFSIVWLGMQMATWIINKRWRKDE